MCCSQATSALDPAIRSLLALLGVTAPPNLLVGVSCVTTESCTQTSLCCQQSLGVVAIGCTLD